MRLCRRLVLPLCVMTALVACRNTPTVATDPPGQVVVRKGGTPKPKTTPTPQPQATNSEFEVIDPFKNTPQATPSPGAIVYRPLTGTKNAAGRTTLKGSVWLSDGTKLDSGVKVVAKSGETVKNSSVQTGEFVFDNLGLSGNVKVTVSSLGRTPRTQLVSLQAGQDYVLHFGEPKNKQSELFAVSPVPEIVTVTKALFAKDTMTDGVDVTLGLSEALPAESVQNLISVVRLLPGSALNSGDGKAPVLLAPNQAADNNKSVDTASTPVSYSVPFFDFASTAATATLSPSKFLDAQAGQELGTGDDVETRQTIRLTFKVPLVLGKEASRYQLALLSNPARPIKDVDGNQLGTDEKGVLNTMPAAGRFLSNAFLSPFQSLDDFKPDDLNTRWASTHTDAVFLEAPADKTPPSLKAIKAYVLDSDDAKNPALKKGTYIELSFSEPMTAFTGTLAVPNAAQLQNLKNYTFAVSVNTQELEGTVLLKGASGTVKPLELNEKTNNFGSGGPTHLGKEFLFTSLGEGQKIEFLTQSTVRLFLPNANLFNRLNVMAIVARVGNVPDPAGNLIDPAVADKKEAQVRTTIAYPTP
ncbi:MAG: hypothetical protein VKP62_12880 [Candidatus Sericytochromatia bacterium]|nr:hypothetical protein [Candidatus Sericytochromatia bacterium]